MNQVYFNPEFVVQMLGHVLGRIYRAMLTAGTSEANHQVGEASVHVTLYGSIHHGIGLGKEMRYLAIFFQETDYRFIQSGKVVVSLVLTGVVNRTAVKYKPSSVTRQVVGIPFL